ncbi:MAG: hypothetical protein QOG45_659, partial [Chloroflexota bacterium]|nr:hypothetical protein [Chloroflexota bacterium]
VDEVRLGRRDVTAAPDPAALVARLVELGL